MLRAVLLLAFAAGAALAADCSGLTGQAKATCFCADKTIYKYYADVDTGCQNAFWCYGPSQAAYVACSPGLLFSDAGQVGGAATDGRPPRSHRAASWPAAPPPLGRLRAAHRRRRSPLPPPHRPGAACPYSPPPAPRRSATGPRP